MSVNDTPTAPSALADAENDLAAAQQIALDISQQLSSIPKDIARIANQIVGLDVSASDDDFLALVDARAVARAKLERLEHHAALARGRLEELAERVERERQTVMDEVRAMASQPFDVKASLQAEYDAGSREDHVLAGLGMLGQHHARRNYVRRDARGHLTPMPNSVTAVVPNAAQVYGEEQKRCAVDYDPFAEVR